MSWAMSRSTALVRETASELLATTSAQGRAWPTTVTVWPGSRRASRYRRPDAGPRACAEEAAADPGPDSARSGVPVADRQEGIDGSLTLALGHLRRVVGAERDDCGREGGSWPPLETGRLANR